jgi:hypothetical protein
MISRILLFTFILGLLLSAQDGKYIRKSVSSFETVWIMPEALDSIKKVNTAALNNFMKFYIEVPRFDFNVLSDNQVANFISNANELKIVNKKTLSRAMENTVVKDILQVLNDPEIQAKRVENFKSESDLETFAATKAKSLGLTTEQLSVMLSSAYIYLPYITKLSANEEDDDLNIIIEGGIIWWRVESSNDGTIEVVEVLNETSKGESTIYLKTSKGMARKYEEYTFGDFKVKTSPNTYAQASAMLAFAKNLGVKTKQLSDFKLQAQVQERTRNGYSFSLGFKEGVHLDDGFFLVELTEDNNGNEKAVDIGFLRISKTGDNIKNPGVFSSAIHLYGERGDVGTIVMEHPKLGVDTRIRFGLRTGMNVEVGHALGYIETTAENAYMLGLDFSYNLAPVIGASQTFLDFGFSVGALDAQFTSTASEEGWFPLLFDAGMGVSKKFWFGRMNVPFGLSGRYQSLSLFNENEESINIWGTAVSLYTGFEYMLNANAIFHIGLDYNLASPITSITTIIAGEKVVYKQGNDLDLWNKGGYGNLGYEAMSLGGLSVRLGIDYAIKSSSLNLFGFLDPLKKF